MKTKRKILIYVFMFFCVLGIITTIYLINNWKKDVNANLEVKKSIDKYISIKEEDIGIDFKELKKINSDTVGYIDVPNTNVNYVVVKGTDNDYYLKHDFNKKNNSSGWIFMDYRNKLDGKDKNLIIFGHNTGDGSMFGSLTKLLDKKNLSDKNNLIINFYTERGRSQYQIFSIYTIKPEEYYLKINFKDDEFERFKKKLLDRSIFKTEIDLKNKNIITLSTCQNLGAKRLVIHAVEI